jgi:hypothetical protein
VTALVVLVAAVLLCFGGMLGASWTTQAMSGVSRRHADERRNLNRGWRELAAARQTRSGAYCPRCDRRMTETNWLLVVDPPQDEEDDGT